MVELKLHVSDVDYESVLQALSGHFPKELISMARAVPDHAKEHLIVDFLNRNANKLEQWMEDTLTAQGIHAHISGASATLLK